MRARHGMPRWPPPSLPSSCIIAPQTPLSRHAFIWLMRGIDAQFYRTPFYFYGTSWRKLQPLPRCSDIFGEQCCNHCNALLLVNVVLLPKPYVKVCPGYRSSLNLFRSCCIDDCWLEIIFQLETRPSKPRAQHQISILMCFRFSFRLQLSLKRPDIIIIYGDLDIRVKKWGIQGTITNLS